MLILDSPGRLVGYIHCRTCHRCVHVDPADVSAGPGLGELPGAAALREVRRPRRGHPDRVGDSCAARHRPVTSDGVDRRASGLFT